MLMVLVIPIITSAGGITKALPKLNTANTEVRKYVLGVARYWLEQGIDGWRLDVPNEIDDDSFWAEFRRVVRSVNRDAYLVGEIWDVNPRWTDDKHFDGLMNILSGCPACLSAGSRECRPIQ